MINLETQDPRLSEWLEGYPPSLFSDSLRQSIELMERYSIDLAIELLERFNVFSYLTEWHTANELCRALSFQPRFNIPLQWLLERILETGCIEKHTIEHDRRYRMRSAPPLSDREKLRALGLQIDQGNAATLDLLDHAASVYPSVASGEQTGDQALFGSHGVALWLNYFNNANPTYAVNNSVNATVAAGRVSAKPTLRILELGAGAGSATEKLLESLEERDLLSRIDKYLVTEPNAFFRRRAQRELSRRYPNLPWEWGALDLNQAWESQLGGQKFDLVCAVNVLHVARDLLFSLNEAHSTLAPGGCLVIGECVRPFSNQPMYPELMFQILGSFTEIKTDPEFRPNPGFLTAEQWRTAFTRSGFDLVEVAPAIKRIREIYPHFFTGAICGYRRA
jgi:SAM-dependent methyltransferase